nr:MAG TPA: hypothetical protein [Caudoviricetes sp.]
MAFVTKTLETELKNVFSTMKSDADFASGIAKAVKNFVSTGQVVTTDAGAVSAGAFVGGGNGTLKVDESVLKNQISTACSTMSKLTDGSGDTVLANAIGNGLLAMTGQAEVNTTVTGTVTTPAGVPSALSGTAKGQIVCVPAPVISGLTACFFSMKAAAGNEGFSGDDDFASQFASLVTAYFTSGVITTNGQAALTGSTGTGAIA